MTDKDKNPVVHAIYERRGADESVTDKPPHVEKFDALVEEGLFKNPNRAAGFAEFLPDGVHISFGNIPSSDRYFVSATFNKKSPIVRPIVWHDRPFTTQSFIFSIEDDGSLVRLIDLFVRKNDIRERVACLETNLGPEAGAEFTEYLLAEPWDDKSKIVDFCKGNEELDRKIDRIHDDIEQARIVAAAVEKPAEETLAQNINSPSGN